MLEGAQWMATGEDTFGTGIGTALTQDDAFSRRVDAYLARALGLACYLLGDPSEAEDATQEAMARAWRARGSLRHPDAFEAWIDRIVVNTCWERLRRTRRLAELNLASTDPPSVPDSFAAVLARDSVGRALIGLTPEQRTVVVLRFWRDLSLDQIAERLDWPLGTVKSRLHYALRALRAQLERDDREVDR
jgi:RNA polymerase sigma factor (sigma-70 family)